MIKIEKKVKNYYFSDEELWKQIKISQGKGKRTKRLEELIILIATRISRVKLSSTPMEDREDILQEMIVDCFDSFWSFNCDKYESAGPYIAELLKRAQTKAFNQITRKKSSDIIPVFFNIEDMMGFDNYNKRK